MNGDISDFLDPKNKVAVVGVSADSKKWGSRIYLTLRKRGYTVYAVNPKYEHVAGDRCYPKISALPLLPDLVISVVPPAVTERLVEECARIGVRRVWMQPGSESEKAVKFCEKNGIGIVYNSCFVVDGLKSGFEGESG